MDHKSMKGVIEGLSRMGVDLIKNQGGMIANVLDLAKIKNYIFDESHSVSRADFFADQLDRHYKFLDVIVQHLVSEVTEQCFFVLFGKHFINKMFVCSYEPFFPNFT